MIDQIQIKKDAKIHFQECRQCNDACQLKNPLDNACPQGLLLWKLFERSLYL